MKTTRSSTSHRGWPQPRSVERLLLAPIASAATLPAPPAAPASAGTDPLVPYGTDPHSPYVFGYHVSDHDEANTTNGQVDVPF